MQDPKRGTCTCREEELGSPPFTQWATDKAVRTDSAVAIPGPRFTFQAHNTLNVGPEMERVAGEVEEPKGAFYGTAQSSIAGAYPGGHSQPAPTTPKAKDQGSFTTAGMEQDHWYAIRERLHRMFPSNRPFGKSSPYVPRSLTEWLEHRRAMKAAEAEQVQRKEEYVEAQKKAAFPDKDIPKAFDGKLFNSLSYGTHLHGDRSRIPPIFSTVLCQQTIWVGVHAPASVPWQPTAEWPCKAEMEWEGDQRVATENGRYGRFPALPRLGHEGDGLTWQERPLIKPYPFDEVRRVPTMEDIIAPVDEIEDPDVIPQLLDQSLLDAMDDLPIPVPTKP